jgi:hypothetical protein
MSVVEPQQPLAISTVQCQRVVEAMGFFRCSLDPFRLDLHPDVPLHQEPLAMEQEEGVKARISPNYDRHFDCRLS